MSHAEPLHGHHEQGLARSPIRGTPPQEQPHRTWVTSPWGVDPLIQPCCLQLGMVRFPTCCIPPARPLGHSPLPQPLVSLTASCSHPQTELTSLHQPPGDAHCPPCSLAGEEGRRTSSFSAPNSTILMGRTPLFQSKAPKLLTHFDTLPSKQTNTLPAG